MAKTGKGNERAAAAYLVGEIHRRSGSTDKSTTWLDKAAKIAKEVESKNIPSWIKACRDRISTDAEKK